MSIPIPPERIPPIAKEVVDSRKTYAILWWFGAVLFLVMALGSNKKLGDDPASTVIGFGFWVVVLFVLGVRQWRIAGRAAAAARLADAGHTSFVLTGKQVIAIDERQVSQPRASFKVSNKLQTMLTALPAATLVEK